MLDHDGYGKQLLWRATDGRVHLYGTSVEIDYGIGSRCRIDAALDGLIAIEVESRTGKQVRGAVLDLICHPYPKKLLILLPVHMDTRIEKRRTTIILGKFYAEADFRVVALNGHGGEAKENADIRIIAAALRELGASFESQPT